MSNPKYPWDLPKEEQKEYYRKIQEMIRARQSNPNEVRPPPPPPPEEARVVELLRTLPPEFRIERVQRVGIIRPRLRVTVSTRVPLIRRTSSPSQEVEEEAPVVELRIPKRASSSNPEVRRVRPLEIEEMVRTKMAIMDDLLLLQRMLDKAYARDPYVMMTLEAKGLTIEDLESEVDKLRRALRDPEVKAGR